MNIMIIEQDTKTMTVDRLRFVLGTFHGHLPVTLDPSVGLVIRGQMESKIFIERDTPSRNIDDDAAKLIGLPPHGAMNPCCGDGYFAKDCESRWGKASFDAACDRARERHKIGMAAYEKAIKTRAG